MALCRCQIQGSERIAFGLVDFDHNLHRVFISFDWRIHWHVFCYLCHEPQIKAGKSDSDPNWLFSDIFIINNKFAQSALKEPTWKNVLDYLKGIG